MGGAASISWLLLFRAEEADRLAENPVRAAATTTKAQAADPLLNKEREDKSS
jgi:hypothetical protein